MMLIINLNAIMRDWNQAQCLLQLCAALSWVLLSQSPQLLAMSVLRVAQYSSLETPPRRLSKSMFDNFFIVANSI